MPGARRNGLFHFHGAPAPHLIANEPGKILEFIHAQNGR
jgi:hypothetical protein